MKSILTTLSIACAVSVGFAVTSAIAQNTLFTPGDLVLCFQKEGGSNTVYARIGNAAIKFRGAAAGPDAINRIRFQTIGAELVNAFGPDWANDPTIYVGASAVWGTSNSTFNNTLQDGDPNRTIYITRARNSVGTVGTANSNAWDLTIQGNGTITSAASGIFQMNNVLATQYTTAVAVSPTDTSQIDDQNPFLSPGIQGPAMQSALEGGIQQAGSATSFGSFGTAGNVEFALDLYRVLAREGITGQVAGTGNPREGTYEGTITVDNLGRISFIATAPVIGVEQPVGTGLVDNTSKTSFGTVSIGSSVTKTYTITNKGNLTLSLRSFLLNGANAANFIVTAPSTPTALAPGASTTFDIMFKPLSLRTSNAAIHIGNTDLSQNAFDIKLTGFGAP